MSLKGDARFKGKLIWGLKKDIRDVVNFHANSQQFQNLHFDPILWSKKYEDLNEKVLKS